MSDEIDLNLLRVFAAVIDTGSVSAAAARLHLSIPATSRALTRLRNAMKDPIVVRAGRGVVPTPFALRAAPRVRTVLDLAAGLRADSASGEPHTWERTFVVRINDGLTPVVAPRLIRRVAAEAQNVTVRFVAQDSKAPEPLRDGAIDLDIGVADPPPPDMRSEQLFVDHFVALVSASSALGTVDELTLDDLCAYPHISASRRGLSRGPLDDALLRQGRSRRVVAVVPTYAVATLLALEDDLICLVPRVVAQHLAERRVPIRWHEIPVELPLATVELRWHRRSDEDAQAQWLRNHVRAAVKPLEVALGVL